MPLKKAFNLLPRIPLSMPARHCLGVEYIDGEIRATLVQARGKKMEILDFVALKVPDSGDDLPGIAQLREMAGRLNCKPGTGAVLASPMARLVTLPMNRDRVKSMKHHLLTEAVKWEAESYTGVPASQALAGVEVEKVRQEPGQVMEETEEVFVHVSILEQNIFRALKERFRLAGLKLVRVYPSEVCFQVPLLKMHADTDRGVLDMGAESSGFALLSGGQTLSINTMNISTAMIREHLAGKVVADLEDTLRFNLGQAPAPLPVAVTGPGALDKQVLDYLRFLSPTGVEPLKLVRASGLTASGSEEGPLFASAAGAAMRELSAGRMAVIGITDAVPLPVKIRQSFYLVPIAAASLLFVLLLGHNLLMRFQENSYQVQRAELQAQIAERRQEQEQVERLRKQITEVTDQISSLRKKKEFVLEDRDRDLRAKIVVFESLVRHLPETVSLKSIRQVPETPDVYVLAGEAVSASEVMDYVFRLKKSGIAVSVEIRRLEVQSGSRGRGANHRFLIQLEADPHGTKADQA
ncbi:PilN domain-containing protein [Desulfonatronovibrio hydrogenovorans]|uniref:PilN domain-containing protein n=1 Tax=Desulfonatronovibrio hydrogenovorans TaxID=53245 RepID=UPI00048DB78B|nr:PilN domain-containing protein [Desulfonatronovibrio hydrogenovorans]